jgi:glycosyltransferase involved in cell wall biosynthesis
MVQMRALASRILCLGKGWVGTESGGLNRYVYEQSRQLALEGNLVHLYGYGMPQDSLLPNLQLVDLGDPGNFIGQRLYSAYANLVPALRQNEPPIDAINLHFALYSLPVLSQLPENIPVTFTFHGPWALESKQEQSGQLNVKFKSWIEQQVYQRCDRFIVLSRAFGKILQTTYQIPEDRIYVIPGGVNTQRFQANLSRTEARKQLNWPLDRPILFTPRRLVHRMGLSQLLSALVKVKRNIPDVWLAIAGKGPLRSTLEQQTEVLQLKNHVQFLGFLPDERLPIAYQAADLTVIPSLSLEGFGLVLLESLACGTPALSTPIGGMPEILEKLDPNLLTQAAEEGAIAERLITYLLGVEKLPSRQACRDYAVTNFDWQAITPKLKKVFLAGGVEHKISL